MSDSREHLNVRLLPLRSRRATLSDSVARVEQPIGKREKFRSRDQGRHTVRRQGQPNPADTWPQVGLVPDRQEQWTKRENGDESGSDSTNLVRCNVSKLVRQNFWLL
jgi:hypothetical protein